MSTTSVIIETPRGSAQKYNFDPKTGYFKLMKNMPAGLVFPYDFGFIEGTIGEDGDPLDVIVVSEIQTFPGCVVDCRIIGAIKAEQRERDGDRMRNDRYIGIPIISKEFESIKSLKDFPSTILKEIEIFFSNYNQQAGKKFTPLQHISEKKAALLLNKSRNTNKVQTKLIQLFLPMVDSSGKAFPTNFFEKVKQTLTNKFKGLSIYENSPVTGKWKNEDSEIVKDKLLVYEVMSDDLDLAYWDKYKQALQKQFKQDSIVIRSSHINLI